MRILDVALFVAIAFLPVYLWSSGGLQPSHYLLAIYCGAYILTRGFGRGSAETILLVLTLVVVAREGFAAIVDASVKSLLPAAHVVYSLVVFNVLSRAMSSDRLCNIVLSGVLVSAAVAVGGVLYIGYSPTNSSAIERVMGTFNNPNQLGYFAVCLFAIAFLYRLRYQLPVSQLIYLIICSVFLAIASLSKAAMLGIAIPLLFVGFTSKRRLASVISGGITFAVACLGFYWLYTSGVPDDYSFIQRLQGIGSQNDDSLGGRGYQLYFDGSLSTFLTGLGQVEAVRRNFDHEVHSTIFSFFVNYGIVGGGLFLAFILLWLRVVWRTLATSGLFLVCLPVMLYGITHNGSRFAIFWVLLSLSFASKQVEQNGVSARAVHGWRGWHVRY